MPGRVWTRGRHAEAGLLLRGSLSLTRQSRPQMKGAGAVGSWGTWVSQVNVKNPIQSLPWLCKQKIQRNLGCSEVIRDLR